MKVKQVKAFYATDIDSALKRVNAFIYSINSDDVIAVDYNTYRLSESLAWPLLMVTYLEETCESVN